MTTRYTFDPAQSQFTVKAFATGMLSFFAHSPTFRVRVFAGSLSIAGTTIKDLRLEALAEALELVDKVSAADRGEIEGRMRRDVFNSAVYPEITFQSTAIQADKIAQGRYRASIHGQLALHGVTQTHQVDAELVVFDDGIRLGGESALRLSDYQILPVTALGGTIKLKDEVRLTFDIAGLPEPA